jgi:formiminotetrahydrofolate cyclodeaminase
LPCVKALGLSLASHNLAQVSMNLTDFETTGIDRAFDAVRAEAEREGVKVVESELIGLVPRRALENVAANTLGIAGFHRGMVLENRLDDTLAAHSVDAFLDGLTGGGAAAAASAAMSAAIALAVPPHIREFQVRRRFFAAAVERDRHAWQAYQQAPPEDSELLLHEAARVPLEVAEEAAWLRGALQRLTAEAPHQYASDLVTAEALASAALAGATATVRANLALMQDAEMARAIEERLDRLS